jgi:hypothetical protein
MTARPTRAADLARGVDQAGGQAGLVRRYALRRGQGHRYERGADAQAVQDQRAEQVRPVLDVLVEPRREPEQAGGADGGTEQDGRADADVPDQAGSGQRSGERGQADHTAVDH